MKYISTRGLAAAAGFEDVLLAGLAPDGGLYMPQRWPVVTTDEIASFAGASYADVAASIIGLFTGDTFTAAQIKDMAQKAYGRFSDPRVAPLTLVGADDYILELYHGPTLAFKDFAMQILGQMFDNVLARHDRRLTIIAATSGDTGAAAIEALKNCNHVDIVVLHPEGRVTDVQRRMMTTVDRPNVHNIAVDGAFDDCQAIIKQLFADREFSERVCLGGVNSINWARLAAQTVYYFTACAALSANGEPVNFVVPTGNFGDVFAGFAAMKMGLGVGKLVVATNANDILHRALTLGDYTPAGVTPTASPSMDIQVASNFERLLFEVMDRDSVLLRKRMAEFASEKSMTLSAREQAVIAQDFASFAASGEQTLSEIKRHHEKTGTLIDPHTAVARCAAANLRAQGVLSGKTVTLSTAHPAKFPEAVEQATGVRPPLPETYSALFDLEEHVVRAENDLSAVRSVILQRVEPARQ